MCHLHGSLCNLCQLSKSPRSRLPPAGFKGGGAIPRPEPCCVLCGEAVGVIKAFMGNPLPLLLPPPSERLSRSMLTLPTLSHKVAFLLAAEVIEAEAIEVTL